MCFLQWKEGGGITIPINLWIPITTSKEERRVGAPWYLPLLGETLYSVVN